VVLTLFLIIIFLFRPSTHIVASCEMDLYEFPMDVQHCKLTFGSCKFALIFLHPDLVEAINTIRMSKLLLDRGLYLSEG